MTGAADPDNRREMDWTLNSNQKMLKKYISALTRLRSEHSALRYGDYYTLRADKQVYAYLRSDFNERILVIISRQNTPKEIQIKFPEELEINHIECLNGSPSVEELDLSKNTFRFKADPYSGYIFKVK